MRTLFFILILISIQSCGSSKGITINAPKKAITSETLKNSNVSSKPIIDTLSKPETISNSETKTLLKINSEEEKEVKKTMLMHDKWSYLLKKHVSDQGNVNYKGFITDRKLLIDYIKNLSNNLPDNTWTKEEKLAYWINAYNAMTIDLILRHYPVNSIKDIKKPWNQRYWKLGEKWYNLNEIEHDILRKMNEPRIHFSIVCASFSCPKLQNEAFSSADLENQLTKATKEFLSDFEKNEISKNSIKLSKIFLWFADDFKEDGTIINFLNTYSHIQISAKAKKGYKDYKWDLNN